MTLNKHSTWGVWPCGANKFEVFDGMGAAWQYYSSEKRAQEVADGLNEEGHDGKSFIPPKTDVQTGLDPNL